MEMRGNPYSREENAIFIGQVPRFRRLMRNGNRRGEAARICSKEIINGPECKVDGVLYGRYKATVNPIDSFAAHVDRIDKVAAGEVGDDDLKGPEDPWNGTIPRGD